MAMLDLTRGQLKKLAAFIDAHHVRTCLISNKDGAFVGAVARADGEHAACVYYFKGCNAVRDARFLHTTRRKFGEHDFEYAFPAARIVEALENPRVRALRFTVMPNGFTIEHITLLPGEIMAR